MEITITDTTAGGKILQEISIAIANERTTLRELIESRVRAEVVAYNNAPRGIFKGLVKPTKSEQVLNGFKVRPKKSIDADEQVYTALDAFQKNGFFVLVDDVQAESLDEEILVGKNTTVSFIKLTPLVGG